MKLFPTGGARSALNRLSVIIMSAMLAVGCAYDKGAVYLPEKQVHYSSGAVVSAVENQYDGSGKLINEKFLGADGGVTSQNVYEYDGDRLIKVIRLDSNEESVGETVRQYDTAGNCISIEYSGGRTEYSFDSVGNAVAENTYDANAVLIKAVTRVYGANGLIEKETDGSGGSYRDYIYDESGRLCEENEFSESGHPLTKMTYEYGDSGLLILRTELAYSEYAGKMVVERYEGYEYNKNGLITLESCYHADGTPESATETKYDPNGNAAEYIGYDSGKNEVWRTVCTYKKFSSK